VIQVASLAFWLPLEIYQMETLGHPTFVIVLRMRNIVGFGLGKMDAWGLTNYAMHWDPWDYVHITTWNFLPFLLRRVGVAPAWVVHLAFAVWSVGLVALAAVLWRLFTSRRNFHRRPGSQHRTRRTAQRTGATGTFPSHNHARNLHVSGSRPSTGSGRETLGDGDEW